MTKGKKTLNCREQLRSWRLDAVESYYLKLKNNLTHPFEDLGDGFYYITVRSDKFYFGIGLIISVTIGFTLFCILVDFFSFPLALFLVFMAYGITSMFGRLSARELIISRNGGYLMRIKNTNKVLVEEPIHNCYIKMMRKYDSNLRSHYYLILGGYNLDDIRISGMAHEDTALRLLGTRLAERMGINYFDYDLNSTLHRILHYPTFSTLRATEAEYHKFLEDHFLSNRDVVQALTSQALPSTTTIVPAVASEQITFNYKVGSRIGRNKEGSQQPKARVGRPTLTPTLIEGGANAPPPK